MLTNNAIAKIKKSKRCKNRLAYELDKNLRTITNWLNDNDIMLTTALAVKIISEETGLKDTEILIEEKVHA